MEDSVEVMDAPRKGEPEKGQDTIKQLIVVSFLGQIKEAKRTRTYENC